MSFFLYGTSIFLIIGSVLGLTLKSISLSDNPDECSCDCCVTQPVSGDELEKSFIGALQTFQCAISQPTTKEGTIPEACSNQQKVPKEVCFYSNLDDETATQQYEHFCYANCSPSYATQQADEQCVVKNSDTSVEMVQARKGLNQKDLNQKKNQISARLGGAEPNKMMVRTRHGQKRSSEDPPISLVKAEMQQAYVYARRAGDAARIAKQAYERILGSAWKLSQKASYAVMSEVKREAREQATTAQRRKDQWVKDNQNAAASVGAAVAGTFMAEGAKAAAAHEVLAKSAAAYRTAQAERQALAEQFELRAEQAEEMKDYERANQNLVQWHQAADQTKRFGDIAAVEEKHAADALAAQAYWESNAPVAEKYEAHAALPPGVDPPPCEIAGQHPWC